MRKINVNQATIQPIIMSNLTYSHPLDNPMWEALSSRQSMFNEGDENLKMFPAEMSPFVGMHLWDEKDIAMAKEKLPKGRIFSFVFHKDIQLPLEFEIMVAIPLYQLVCTTECNCTLANPDSVVVRSLTIEDIPKMLEITAMTKPGPFTQRTIEFGDYMGIFCGEQLVAMAGNRMKVPGYSEVSAICTHPDHLGKKYASFLTAQACERIRKEGFTPFLHVKADNQRAIEVYKRMGFEIRAEVYYKIFKLKEI